MHPARNTTAHCTTQLQRDHQPAYRPAAVMARYHGGLHGRLWRGFGTALMVALLALMPPVDGSRAAARTGGTWAPTGYMITARYGHTATLLPDGQILVAGGCAESTCGGAFASAELYDPRTGTWTYTGSMLSPRLYATATLLPSGKVLVAGGSGTTGAELYDPSTGTWTATGTMATPNCCDTATLLADGAVLVTDAGNGGTAEVYDPRTGTWTPTGCMCRVGSGNAAGATLLPDGQVLAVGGIDAVGPPSARAELYNPMTGTWTATGSLHTGRVGFATPTLLPNGQVLVAGGCTNRPCVSPVAGAELYNPSTGTWKPTGSLITTRAFHTATLLPDGTVLVAGGFNCIPSCYTGLTSAEVYDPRTGTWAATGSMSTARDTYTATLLPNGLVLAAGGCCALASAELYTPAPPLPTLEVTPTSGVYRQPITLRGAHFAPAEVVNVYANATTSPPLYSTTADASGAFVLRTAAHQGAYGWQRLVAVGQSSGRTALTRFFNRPSLALAPASGAVGTTVRVQGDGFGADEPVQVQWNTPSGPVLGSALSDGRGHVATTVTVPASTAGAHQVWGVGQDSGAQAHALFTVP